MENPIKNYYRDKSILIASITKNFVTNLYSKEFFLKK